MRKDKTKYPRKKRKSFFNPDVISTEIASCIREDITSSKNVMYASGGSSLMYSEIQVRDTLKKYCSPVQDSRSKLESECFSKFLSINSHMLKYSGENLFLPSEDSASACSDRHRKLWLARWLVYRVLGDVSTEEIFKNSRHSGGSSLGVPFMDTSLRSKSSVPISCTRRVKTLLSSYLTYDFRYREAIRDLGGSCDENHWYDVVSSSRATTVDKTTDKRRMIAVEPTGNMFFQQGLMAIMYQRLKKVGLDVESLPSKHKYLAWLSSITSSRGTIDWSSASDTVSYDLVRWLLPPRWFWWVDIVRCPLMTISGRQVKLNMFSTMGNATTFPLETLVLWSLGMATIIYDELPSRRKWPQRPSCIHTYLRDDRVSVFGDDCILPTPFCDDFVSLAESVGFIVNSEKSFYKASGFRESCGGDYYRGYDVRPFMLRAPTSTSRSALEPWLYTVMNRCLEKYMSYFGTLAYLYNRSLLELFRRLTREYNIFVKVVPHDFPDDAGLKIGHDLARFRLCYPGIRFSNISMDQHGTVHFSFCRFRYRNEASRFDHVTYSWWLKNPPPIMDSRDVLRNLYPSAVRPFDPIRKKGGYVVAKGKSSFWDLSL